MMRHVPNLIDSPGFQSHPGNSRTSMRTLVALALAVALLLSATTARAAADDWAPDRLIVQTRGGVPADVAQMIFARHGAEVIDVIPDLNTWVLRVPPSQLSRVEAGLSTSRHLKSVGKDYLRYLQATAPNDPWFPAQWHLAKIQAPQAWDYTVGTSAVVIAIVDSGVTAVPDLASKLLPGVNLIDAADTSDGLNHGTPVAGAAAAATNNSFGVAGVNWGSTILPVKIYNSSGSTTCSAVIDGIKYAADHGARVINMSFAGTSACSGESSAIDYAWSKGAVLVAAAGNSASTTPNYPAAYRNVLGVAGSRSDDTLDPNSNHGSWVSVTAPGVGIYTTYNTGTYSSSAGTSIAAPVVSGLAALVIAANPMLSNAQVKQLIEDYSDDLGALGFDTTYGWGRVNAYRAVMAAGGTAPSPADKMPPVASINSPNDGSSVSGVATVNVSASDDTGVTRVELHVDGTVFASDPTAPHSFAWDTSAVNNGTHRLEAVAYDAAGNSGDSNQVSVTVDNLGPAQPTVAISSPVNGSSVTGTVKIKVLANGSSTIKKIEAYADGNLVGSNACASTSCSATIRWNSKPAAAGQHTLSAKAYDAAGNVAASSEVNVWK